MGISVMHPREWGMEDGKKYEPNFEYFVKCITTTSFSYEGL